MKVRVSEAERQVLDWMVAKAEGAYTPTVDTDIDGTKRINYGGMYPEWSTDWSQGGPIIERERLSLTPRDGYWDCYVHDRLFEEDGTDHYSTGTTPLIAAMRCYVSSKLGDEIDVPEELQ